MVPDRSLAPGLPTSTPKAASSNPGAGLRSAFHAFVRLTVADGMASERTVKSYAAGLEHFLAWCVRQDINPEKAGRTEIERYRSRLASEFARATIKLRLIPVRLLYEALQRSGRRLDNPAAYVRAPRDRTKPAQAVTRKALEPAEVTRFVSALSVPDTIHGSRDRAIILLMLLQGLRAHEVAGLLNDNVDLDAFNHVEIHGKGRKWRTVVLCRMMREAMIRWSRYRGKMGMAWPLFYSLESPRIGDSDPKPLSVRTIERITDKYLRAAGLKRKGRSAHSLRHTYAIMAVLAGAKREKIGESMGHESLSTTDIYIRAAAIWQDNPADAVNNLIEKGVKECRP